MWNLEGRVTELEKFERKENRGKIKLEKENLKWQKQNKQQ